MCAKSLKKDTKKGVVLEFRDTLLSKLLGEVHCHIPNDTRTCKKEHDPRPGLW